MNRDKFPSPAQSETEQQKVETHITENEAAYWAEFYSRNDFNQGSSFYEFINSLPELPDTIVDIGCGQGRDSFAFAQSGRQVIGLDRSEVGVSHASQKARSEELSDKLAFATCDVSDEYNLYENLIKAREAAQGANICYYMRFFLHSVPEEVQEKLMEVIAYHAEPGDVFTAEFRTDKDEDLTKNFGDTHYRRYQNADEFSTSLKEVYGWDTVYETESQGLSPYKDEDPTLYRVIAVK